MVWTNKENKREGQVAYFETWHAKDLEQIYIRLTSETNKDNSRPLPESRSDQFNCSIHLVTSANDAGNPRTREFEKDANFEVELEQTIDRTN